MTTQVTTIEQAKRIAQLWKQLSCYVQHGSVLVRADEFTLVEIQNYAGASDGNSFAAFGRPCSTLMELYLVRHFSHFENELIFIEKSLKLECLAGITNAILAVAGFAGWMVSNHCSKEAGKKLAGYLGRLVLMLCEAERLAVDKKMPVPQLGLDEKRQFSNAMTAFFQRAKSKDPVADPYVRVFGILTIWHTPAFDGGQRDVGNSGYFVDEMQGKIFFHNDPRHRQDMLFSWQR